MSVIRRRPLNLRQKVRVESQLQHMLGMGTPLQLSIGHFIAEGTELRRALDALQKIRPATPVFPKDRSLEDDLGALGQGGARGLRIGGQVGAGDLDDRDAAGLQPRKMRRLMGIALLLQQNRNVTVLPGRRPFALEVTKIKRGGMRTAHEPHQVRCGQQYPALYSAHRRPPLSTTTSCYSPTVIRINNSMGGCQDLTYPTARITSCRSPRPRL